MRKPLLLFALVALAASAGIIESASADQNRRQVRREAIVVGVVRNKVATDITEARYRECMRGSRYDQDCDRQRWEDEQAARRKGRRAAIIVGAQ